METKAERVLQNIVEHFIEVPEMQPIRNAYGEVSVNSEDGADTIRLAVGGAVVEVTIRELAPVMHYGCDCCSLPPIE